MTDPSDAPPASPDTGPAPPSDRTTITLIRHGESEVTVDRIIGGKRTCRGLSPLGRTQAEHLRDRLSRDGVTDVDALIASDFPRAIETADIIRPVFAEAGAPHPVEQWSDLGEHDPGPEIDGMSFEAYVERYGTPNWSGDPDVEIFPGGETVRRFHERVLRGLTTLLEEFAGRHVVVVCHGGVVDAAFRILLDLPRTAAFELHTLNTALTTFSGPAARSSDEASDGAESLWRLARYNDTAHLAGLPDATPRRT
ncbi:MAG: histidine phosphatase family protein [Ilumatobacter sp.]|uniref:histidine phosphatase family protein n=1 Tax=Ilumatobacter sp. TaxID=1967498 RepID=UPI003C77689F